MLTIGEVARRIGIRPSAVRYYERQGMLWYVDRLLKGAKPQDLPVEVPNYFELIITIRTAKQIGVSIPSYLLASADKVIR